MKLINKHNCTLNSIPLYPCRISNRNPLFETHIVSMVTFSSSLKFFLFLFCISVDIPPNIELATCRKTSFEYIRHPF